MPRSEAQKHLDAQKAGATLIVKGTAVLVQHKPRHDKDHQPWLGTDGKRYTSAEIGRTVL